LPKRGGIYHYVPHAHRAEWEAIGWVHAADLGLPNIYKWAGEGKPIMPYLAEEREKGLADFDYVWPDTSAIDL